MKNSPLKEAMKIYERQHIIRTLEEANNDKKQAADMLGIGLSSLYRKMEELSIIINEDNSQNWEFTAVFFPIFEKSTIQNLLNFHS